jgi:hypothetical protein
MTSGLGVQNLDLPLVGQKARLPPMRRLLFFGILLVVLLPQFANASTVSRVAMIFEQPSETSKQVLIIDEGGHLVVTGATVTNAEGAWSPVQSTESTPVVSGWVHTRVLEMEPGDYGFEQSPERHPVGLDLYISGGTGYLTSNAQYFAGKVTGGADLLLGHSKEWVFGAALTKYISGENLPNNPLDGLQRFSTEVSGGYYLIPHRLLLRGIIGADYISSNQQYADTRVAAVFGASLRYQFPITKKFWLGLETCYQYITTSNSYNDLYYNDAADGYSVPHASVYTWNLVFNFSLL